MLAVLQNILPLFFKIMLANRQAQLINILTQLTSFVQVTFLLFLINLCTWQALAQSYTLTDDDVIVVDGVIASCSYDFSNKDIVIPSLLDGQTVIGITNNLSTSGIFMGQGLESILLPETLETIGSSTFAANNLSEIILPVTLQQIGYGCFYQNQLTELNIPTGVEVIGALAFSNNSLNSVSFEASSNLDIIYGSAFSDNAGLSGIVFPIHGEDDFDTYFSESGVAFAPGQSFDDFSIAYYANVPYVLTDADVVVSSGVITSCSYDFERNSIIIPETLDGQQVRAIGSIGGIDGLFNGIFSQKGLRHVKLPESMTSIGRFAFMSNALLFVDLPETLTNISIYAFAYNRLNNIVLPPNLTRIETATFRANSIKDVTLPTKVETIAQDAFFNNRIELLVIPESIIEIEKNAFLNNQLSSVVFESNSNIKTILTDAFSGNSSLVQIELPEHKQSDLSSYFDSNNQQYQPGDHISDFSLTYHAKVAYTLTDDDVVVSNGVIMSCSHNFENHNSLIIPNILDNQTVTGIIYSSSGIFGNKGLVSVDLPNSLKTVGQRAFYNNSLISIDLPDGLETIDRSAFERNALTNLTIPTSVKEIGYYAFQNNALETVQFEQSSYIHTIEQYAFRNNSSLGPISLPTNATPNFKEYLDSDGVVYQPGDQLLETDHAMYAIIPYTLTDADVEVTNGVIVSSSYDLPSKHIIIPNQLDGQTITGIEGNYYYSGAFQGRDIVSLELPSTLKFIADNSFRTNDISRLVIPNSVESIGYRAFEGNHLNKVAFEEESNILFIGESAFKPYSSQVSLSFTLPTHAHADFINYADSNGNRHVEGEEYQYNNQELFARIPYVLSDNEVEIINNEMVSIDYDQNYKVIVIPDVLDGQEIHMMADRLFYDHGIDSVRLPGRLTTIGKYTFSRNNLHTIAWPTSLKVLKDEAFSINRIERLDFSASLQMVGKGAFKKNELNEVNFSAFRLIDREAFHLNTNLDFIVLPPNTDPDFIEYGDTGRNRYHPNDEFSRFDLACYARIPYVLTDNDVVMEGDTIVSTSIDEWNKVIVIPEKLHGETIGAIGDAPGYNSTLFNIEAIDSLHLPSGLKSIGNNVFKSNNLQAILLPDGMIHIGTYAFRANAITEVNIPNSIQHVGDYAFEINHLEQVAFSEPSDIEYIGYSAFKSSNSALEYIVLPTHAATGFFDYKDTQGNIYKEADQFVSANQKLMTRILYTLTDEDVVVKEDTLISCDFDLKYKIVIIPDQLDGQGIVAIADNNSVEGNPNFVGHHLDSVRLPSGLKYIGKSAFYNNTITAIDLPDGLTVVKENAFKNNGLKELEIPKQVTEIGNYAFQANALISVTFEESSDLDFIGKGAFSSNYSLNGIALPTNTHSEFIAYRDEYGNNYNEGEVFNKFYYYLSRQYPYQLLNSDVEIVNGKIISCNYSFHSKYIIISDTLDNQYVTGIAGSTWEYTAPFRGQALDSVRLPSGLKFIGPSAFDENSLKKLVLPDSLKTIKENAFSNNQLTSIEIPKHVIQIGKQAFEDNNLVQVVFQDSSEIEIIGERAFYYNFNLISYILPTHGNPEFFGYVDNYGSFYQSGAIVNQFLRSYKAQLITYPLIIEKEGDGTVSPGVGIHEYNRGQSVSLIAYVNSFWAFEKWIVDDKEYADPIIEVLMENDTIYAKAYFRNVLSITSEQENLVKKISVYPNPFADDLTISIPNESSINEIVIYGLGGQVFHRNESGFHSEINLDLSDLKSGIYFIKVSNSDGQSLLKKLVKF